MLAAAYPAAVFYREPKLAPLVMALALVPPLQSFYNIGITEYRKRLEFQPDFVFQVSKKISAFAITVPLAFAFRSYWRSCWYRLQPACRHSGELPAAPVPAEAYARQHPQFVEFLDVDTNCECHVGAAYAYSRTSPLAHRRRIIARHFCDGLRDRDSADHRTRYADKPRRVPGLRADRRRLAHVETCVPRRARHRGTCRRTGGLRPDRRGPGGRARPTRAVVHGSRPS